MATIIHVSDIHLVQGSGSRSQGALLDRLVDTLRSQHEEDATPEVTLAITGDVFDSSTRTPRVLVEQFLALHARIVDALGGNVPTIIVPGNHDRRALGLFGPHRAELFQALHDAADPRQVFVAGCKTPFLAELVPAELHRLPMHVVAYDSSYLPHGLVGAGGTIRHEDLLHVHAKMPADGKPLLLLVHHHLIPTPLTDISQIDSVGAPRLARWLLSSALPALVSNADREELTMTALGAGTALSILHAFGRAVLLLHGHKHVPTARLLRGMTGSCGDLLLASAGSAGRRERVHAIKHPDAARLWPSFNRVTLTEEQLRVESISFAPKKASRPAQRRELARAGRDERRWLPEPVSPRVKNLTPRVAVDLAQFTLSPAHSPDRWDLRGERTVELRPGARLRRYTDFVHALPPGLHLPRTKRARFASRRIDLQIEQPTIYEIPNALCRTLAESAREYSVGTAFEWVGLLCRYGALTAALRLARKHLDEITPFGSVTDLTTGRERPVRVVAEEDHWTLSCSECAPRSLLRIYWPLEASSPAPRRTRSIADYVGHFYKAVTREK